MLTDCPHCLSTVIPMEGGRCPSCRKDMRAVPPSQWVSVSVRLGVQLPDICMLCARPTKHRASICEDRRIGGEDFFTKLVLLFAAPRLLFSGSVRGKEQVLNLNVPVCVRCHQERPIRPKYTSFERDSMTFIVHRDFKQALAGL